MYFISKLIVTVFPFVLLYLGFKNDHKPMKYLGSILSVLMLMIYEPVTVALLLMVFVPMAIAIWGWRNYKVGLTITALVFLSLGLLIGLNFAVRISPVTLGRF